MNAFDRNQLDKQIKPLWLRIKPDFEIDPGEDPSSYPSWSYRITPPFPSRWPGVAASVLTQYVYASALALRLLQDGEYVAAPWATIQHQPGGANEPEIVLLTDELHELGVQGVRPLSESEIGVRALGEEAGVLLLRLREGGKASHRERSILSDFYRMWVQTNGVIADRIRTFHEPFFSWIEKERLFGG